MGRGLFGTNLEKPANRVRRPSLAPEPAAASPCWAMDGGVWNACPPGLGSWHQLAVVVLPLSRLADQKTFSSPTQTFANLFLPFRYSYGRRRCCSCPSFPLPYHCGLSTFLHSLIPAPSFCAVLSLNIPNFSITSIIARPSYNSDVIRLSGAPIVEASTLERTNPAIPLRRLSVTWCDPSHPTKSTSPTTTNSVSDRHERQHA